MSGRGRGNTFGSTQNLLATSDSNEYSSANSTSNSIEQMPNTNPIAANSQQNVTMPPAIPLDAIENFDPEKTEWNVYKDRLDNVFKY